MYIVALAVCYGAQRPQMVAKSMQYTRATGYKFVIIIVHLTSRVASQSIVIYLAHNLQLVVWRPPGLRKAQASFNAL